MRADVGVGTLYRRFPNKADLLDAVVEAAHERKRQIAEAVLAEVTSRGRGLRVRAPLHRRPQLLAGHDLGPALAHERDRTRARRLRCSQRSSTGASRPGRSVPTSRSPTSWWCSWRCAPSPTSATRSPPSRRCASWSSLLDGLRPGHESGGPRPAHHRPARPDSASALTRVPRRGPSRQSNESRAASTAASSWRSRSARSRLVERARPVGQSRSAPGPPRARRRARTAPRRPASAASSGRPGARRARQTGAFRRRPGGASEAATIRVRLRASSRRCAGSHRRPAWTASGDARLRGRPGGQRVVERRRPGPRHQTVPPAHPPQAETAAFFEHHDHGALRRFCA